MVTGIADEWCAICKFTTSQFRSKTYDVHNIILDCYRVPLTTLLKDSDPGPVRGLRIPDNLGVPHVGVKLDHPPSRTDTEPPLPIEIVTPPNDGSEFVAVETSPVIEEPVALSFSQGIHPGLDTGHNSNVQNVDGGSTGVHCI